jgi:hypothetical protein
MVGDATLVRRPPSTGPFEVDLNAGGALVWPHLPSTAQLVKNPRDSATYAYLFVNQKWARSVGITNGRFYAEDGPGGGGGKWPLAAGLFSRANSSLRRGAAAAPKKRATSKAKSKKGKPQKASSRKAKAARK